MEDILPLIFLDLEMKWAKTLPCKYFTIHHLLNRLWKEESTTSRIWITLMTGRRHHRPGTHTFDRASSSHALWKCFGRWLPILRARGKWREKGAALSICHAVTKVWFSLATQAQAQARTQAIGIPKWKRNSTQTQAQAKSSEHSKLFRRKVLWIQCFHWPNVTTCGKHSCVCVMPKRYFIFSCCIPNASISASKRKRTNFDPWAYSYACTYACLKTVFTVK